MDLSIPVRDVDFWRATGGPLLHSLLAYSTDDQWSFEFSHFSGYGRPSENPTLFSNPPDLPASVALFSGGLDSYAGIVNLLEQRTFSKLVTFSARTGNRIGRPQETLLDHLEKLYPKTLIPISARFGLRDRVGHSFDDEDRSQRSRGFAFQTFGAITAAAAGLSELLILENGVGAINLPYLDSQLGCQATRAANPITLALMTDLVRAVIRRPFAIRLPFAFHTKAELCVAIRGLEAATKTGETVSCDHYPGRRAGQHQCGLCCSCILRRQSLYAAGLGDHDSSAGYRADILRLRAGARRGDLLPLFAMDAQERTLSAALAGPDGVASLVRRYPTILEAAHAMGAEPLPEVLARIADMYRRYCDEWRAFREMCPSLERAA